MKEVGYDDTQRMLPPLKGEYCGENRYDVRKNALQFTISHNC